MDVELRNVSKTFGAVHALNGVNVRLCGGKVLLLEGPNGSGKSTLLKILATALTPDGGGEYLWDGQPVKRVLEKARPHIGFLGEKAGLYEDLTVEENILFWTRLYGSGDGADALGVWNLAGYAARPVRTLSQGMQKRLGLARITAQNPSLILLDEPFNGLDSANAEVLQNTLGNWKRQGKAVAVATHQPSLLMDIADQRLHLGKDFAQKETNMLSVHLA